MVFHRSSRRTEPSVVSDRLTPTTACLSAAADADDTVCRRHGDGDGVRSDSDDVGRSRRMRGKRVLVRQCRLTREQILTFYSDNTTCRCPSAQTLTCARLNWQFSVIFQAHRVQKQRNAQVKTEVRTEPHDPAVRR